MNIVVAGPGAMGCLFACHLAMAFDTSRHQVTLLDHNEERAARLNTNGLRLILPDGEKLIGLPVSAAPSGLPPADLLLLCTKSHAVENALRMCRPLLSVSTHLIFMQNGIGHLGLIESMTQQAIPILATSTEGATLLAEGCVRHAGKGITYLGFVRDATLSQWHQLSEVADIFTASGLETRASEDIHDKIWSKLLINVGINGLTVRFNCLNGELLNNVQALEMMEQLVSEGLTVARACGRNVPSDILAITHTVCKNTAKNVSSMLQDNRAGKKTEIEAINGAIVMRGKDVGIKTPANEELTRLIQSMEMKSSTPTFRNTSK